MQDVPLGLIAWAVVSRLRHRTKPRCLTLVVSCGVALWEELGVVLSRGDTGSGWAVGGMPREGAVWGSTGTAEGEE